jgi:hypothetical protein
MNWFQGAQQPNSSTGAAMQGVFNPWAQQAAQATSPGSVYSPQMVSGARADLLAQLGMGLMAAGQPMSGAQRAQYLAQLGQVPAAYQQDLAQRLQAQQQAQLYQQQQAFRDVINKASPEQLDALGIPRGAADIYRSLPASSQTDIIEKKLTAQPGDPNTQVVNVNGRMQLIDQRSGDTIKDLGPVTADPTQQAAIQGQQFKQEQQLYDNYVKDAKPFADTRVAYQHMQSAAQVTDPAYKPQSDIAMVFGFMKMLDPTSTVREGEQASAKNAGGVPTTIQNLYNTLIGGGSLTEDQRAGMMAQANQAYQTQLQSYAKTRQQYQITARSYNLDPDRVAPDLTLGVGLPDPYNLMSP